MIDMIQRFRAWHKKEKKMYDIWVIDWGTRLVNTHHAKEWFSFDDIILVQSTGLKDKNGKEIFCGDLIIIGDDMYQVDIDEFGILTAFPINKKLKKQMLGIVMKIDGIEVEIIGNIHKNPEMLKECV